MGKSNFHLGGGGVLGGMYLVGNHCNFRIWSSMRDVGLSLLTRTNVNR